MTAARFMPVGAGDVVGFTAELWVICPVLSVDFEEEGSAGVKVMGVIEGVRDVEEGSEGSKVVGVWGMNGEV
jgi:hypothetical protein